VKGLGCGEIKKKKNEITIRSSAAEYLTYVAATGDNEQSFEMRYQDENIWLTQKMMSVLYDVSVQNIGQHIKKVFADSELDRAATIKKFFIVQKEGEREVSREVEHYSENAGIFCQSSEQVALCRSRQYRRRGHLQSRKCRAGAYGFDHMERCAGGENPAERRDRRQKLPDGNGNAVA
jgi:hypothetical protein